MAEKLVNEFTVNRPIDEAWPVICDLERIAPCLPGAQLEEIEGDEYRGVVKVKLGAVATQFKGAARFVDRDDDAHRAELKAEGRDTGGRGNASANIVAEAESLSPTSTKCTVTADLHITGKVAQFSRGILGDVSKKLMSQFADNLNTMLDEMSDEPADAAGGSDDAATASSSMASDDTSADSTPSAPSATTGAPAGADTAATSGPTVRKIDGPATEPIDMAGLAGPAVAKRIAPALLGLLVILLLLRRRRSR